MRISEELWDRTGEILEEMRSSKSVRSTPKVKVLTDIVVIEIEDYDFRYENLKNLKQEFPSLEQSDKYDVNTNEGFRFVIRGDE